MEQAKPRYYSLLVFVVFVNFLLSLATIGFMVYKVQTLEHQIGQLQSKSSGTAQVDNGGSYGDDTMIHRIKRSSQNYPEEPKSCLVCHNACVQLFGLGTSAKVCIVSP